jgi:hypothetical protein
MMDLSRNMFNASTPSCFKNSRLERDNMMLSTVLWQNDSVTEDIHLEVEFTTKHKDYFYKGKVLEKTTGLDFSCNMLTGIIPFQIGDLRQTRAFKLSHNHLSGPIPITFSTIT